MNLRITTPLSVVIDADGVRAIRAEDESGGFGVLTGHADFLSALSISVLAWTDADGRQHYCAVRGGVLSVTEGRNVAVATRQAVADDDLDTLEQSVLARFRADLDAERAQHVEGTRLQFAAIRQIMRHLRPDSGGAFT
jgi:F-type H+-transporting ATPase subunit epsilon